MDEAVGTTRYWCHTCSHIVSLAVEVEVKCPTCQSGSIEEVEASSDRDGSDDSGVRPGRSGVRVHLVPRRDGSDDSGEDESRDRVDRESESEMNHRRRISTAILEMLQELRNQMASDFEDSNGENREWEPEMEREEERRERVILINPFNHTIIVQGSFNFGDNHGHGDGEARPFGSVGDYFVGPSLDTLLQHLAENDPNRYGTPPAKKEAIDAMPSVTIEDNNTQCSICLEDLDIGSEAKEVPCKHKFHEGCIKSWLELHSSCPVCRYQMPADESKIGSARRANDNTNNDSDQDHGDDDSGNDTRFSITWPFNALFSFVGNNVPSSGSSDDNGAEN